MSPPPAKIFVCERGVIELPSTLYQRIRKYLPPPLQDYDRGDRGNLAAQSKRPNQRVERFGKDTHLHTRATWAIEAACAAAGIEVELHFDWLAGPLRYATRPTGQRAEWVVDANNDSDRNLAGQRPPAE